MPLQLPVAVPGPYEIDVRLYKHCKAISAQCVDYSVGAADDAKALRRRSAVRSRTTIPADHRHSDLAKRAIATETDRARSPSHNCASHDPPTRRPYNHHHAKASTAKFHDAQDIPLTEFDN